MAYLLKTFSVKMKLVTAVVLPLFHFSFGNLLSRQLISFKCVSLETLIVAQLLETFPTLEYEGSLSSSQAPACGSYSETMSQIHVLSLFL